MENFILFRQICNWLSDCWKVSNKSPVIRRHSQKLAYLRNISRGWPNNNFLYILHVIWYPLCIHVMAKKYYSSWNNSHSGLSFRLAALSLSNTCLTRLIWSSKVLLKIMISSKYIKHVSYCNPFKANSMTRWNVAGALVKPKGIVTYSKCPYLVTDAVFGISCSLTFTWW